MSGCASYDDPSTGATLAGDGLGRAGLALRRHYTAHYAVSAVGPARAADRDLPGVAQDVGRWMESALAHYERLAGLPAVRPGAGAQAAPLPVIVHLSRRAYDYEAARMGFPPRLTSGFCTLDGVVHVYMGPTGTLDPAATLMHEGFHQYCHRLFAYPTPADVSAAYAGRVRPRLPTVPLWLAEGLATVFEAAALGADWRRPDPAYRRLDGLNRPRLDQLRQMLRRGQVPPLAELMSLQLGDSLSPETYAALWGLCYDLLRGGRMEPVPLGGLLAESGSLWGMDAAALLEECLREPDARSFERAWSRRVAQAALARFRGLAAAHGQTLESWERGWLERMDQIR